MAYTPKVWHNSPTTDTPLSAAGIIDLETRVTNIGWGGITSQTGATYTAVAGDVVYANPASGNQTVTLPAAVASTTVTVYAGSSVSGTNQITVSRAGGATISGVGLSAVTSFPLGAPGAYASLTSDGTNWYLVSGQQDTGWLSISAMSPHANISGGINPSWRAMGDRVIGRGTQNVTGTITGGNTLWTMPTSLRVASNQPTLAVYSGASVTMSIGGGGVVSIAATLSNGNVLYLEGLSYSLIQ